MSEEENADLPKDRDGLLQMLCSMADDGLNAPVTLYVKGTIISGTLIGRREYLNGWVKTFSSAGGEDLGETLKDAFGLNETDDTEKPFTELRFVHLKDAKVFTPGQRPLPANGMEWRGKLADVDGFNLGIFQESEE